MTNKYKISELAKDFGLTSKDIIKIIAEKTGADKKSSTALDEKEISLVLTRLQSKTRLKALPIILLRERNQERRRKRQGKKKKIKSLPSRWRF